MTYKAGQKVVCEECNEEWEDQVDDYVRPGFGLDSLADESCWHCDVLYTVVKNRDGTFDVEKA